MPLVCLMCGHDHLCDSTDLGELADRVHMYHDGHYSYAGRQLSPRVLGWGYSEVALCEDGVRIRYIEPAADYVIDGEKYHREYCEREEIFYPRRDL